ncbi:Hypothetical predicted protein [Paramuricea clavata]|uniref:Uncharacterized protein n=1 Tax=Paramuricea clavata TaxID=317549 RepID=A0A7D9DBP5_PARCT|nr:Hypothetical predicted protein [Paramuricea clavata]
MYVGIIFLWTHTRILDIDIFEELSERLINEVKNNYQMLEEENATLQQKIEERDELIKGMKIECDSLKMENRKRFEEKLLLENKLQQLNERHQKFEKRLRRQTT